MSKPDGGPAFPGVVGVSGHGNVTPIPMPSGEMAWVEHTQGMTLRDHFAAIALGAHLSGRNYDHRDTSKAATAATCYSYADAMIAERIKS